MPEQQHAQQETAPTPPQPPAGVIAHRDLAYVTDGHERQKLDLYLPEQSENHPLIIWIHGGAFRMGSKEGNEHDPLPYDYLTEGYALASINYRLSQHAIFPAQIEDCKAAVRWLRAHAAEFKLDPNHFAAWGPSAGGHLVTMLGTAGDVAEFEVGAHLDLSSRVQCVVDYFGPTDFLQMDAQRLPDGMIHDAPDSPESELVGGNIQEHPEKVTRANPITYVTNGVPPFLVVHGNQDPLVPYGQSVLLVEALQKVGADVTFYTVEGAGHGRFTDPAVPKLTAEFLARHIGSTTGGVSMQTAAHGVTRTATAQVTTAKAERYLKALCNHFDRRAKASYATSDSGATSGRIEFDFGGCRMDAEAEWLTMHVSAASDEQLDRIKNVIANHLLRFAAAEELQVHWIDQ